MATETVEMVGQLREAAKCEALDGRLRSAMSDAANFIESTQEIMFERFGFEYDDAPLNSAEIVKALRELFVEHGFG
jgi:hypothetical protein